MDISKLLATVVVAGLLATGCGSGGPSDANAAGDDGADRVPLIVDYSPTLSDVPALMYLATHPGSDLVAVTLAGTGESECGPGVRNTVALLRITGHADVPVACGPEEPLIGSHHWPAEFVEASRTVPGVVLPGIAGEVPVGDAVATLVSALEAAEDPVVIVALGPLTNLGILVAERPDLLAAIDRIVIMGGAIDVAGNVPDSPTVEWNFYIDPEADQRVLGSGVKIVVIPLDATVDVPGSRAIQARLDRASALEPGGEAVRQLHDAAIDVISSEGWFFWDELAAVAATDPEVVTLRSMALLVDADGATVNDPAGPTVLVATAADPALFADRFADVLSGGTAPTVSPLDDAERAYLSRLDELGATLSAATDAAFTMLFSFEGSQTVVSLGDTPVVAVEDVFDAFADFAAGLATIDPPQLFRTQHENIRQSLGTFAALREGLVDGVRELLDSARAMTADEFLTGLEQLVAARTVDDPLASVAAACAEVELEAELRGVQVTTGCA
ncbi:MAG: nucleoside hydrolase [Acidimicrobiales bacterium]